MKNVSSTVFPSDPASEPLDAGLTHLPVPRPLDDNAILRVLNPILMDRLPARVLTFSKASMSLRMTNIVPVGALVQIRLDGGFWVLAEVSSSAALANGFFITLHIESIHRRWAYLTQGPDREHEQSDCKPH